MRTVVLDPGHGGMEPLALSTPIGVRGACGTQEKELTLALARRVRAQLAPYLRVHLTRDGDRNLSLADRALAARTNRSPRRAWCGARRVAAAAGRHLT